MVRTLNRAEIYYDEEIKGVKTGLSSNALFDANPAYRDWIAHEALPRAIESSMNNWPSATRLINIIQNQKRFRKWCEWEGREAEVSAQFLQPPAPGSGLTRVKSLFDQI